MTALYGLRRSELLGLRGDSINFEAEAITIRHTLKDVQEWLGHADIKMTANLYSHLDMTRKVGMAEKLSKTFGENG